MRVLKFSIHPETLILHDFVLWKDVDKDYFRECARNNMVEMKRLDHEPKHVICKGNLGDMYSFLNDLSYRYDIELV